MKVDVTFVNFSASDLVKNLIANRIEQQVGKYNERFGVARAVFSMQGSQHHVRINLVGGDTQVSVCATASDVGRSVDRAIDKLGGSLRKMTARRKHHRNERPISDSDSISFHGMRRSRGTESTWENAFDRFEDEFVRDFEERFERAG